VSCIPHGPNLNSKLDRMVVSLFFLPFPRSCACFGRAQISTRLIPAISAPIFAPPPCRPNLYTLSSLFFAACYLHTAIYLTILSLCSCAQPFWPADRPHTAQTPSSRVLHPISLLIVAQDTCNQSQSSKSIDAPGDRMSSRTLLLASHGIIIHSRAARFSSAPS